MDEATHTRVIAYAVAMLASGTSAATVRERLPVFYRSLKLTDAEVTQVVDEAVKARTGEGLSQGPVIG
jgi:hypothetical protein